MMNTRGHLPAGQQVQSGADMGPVPAGGPGPRPRGGRPQHYAPAGQYAHYHHHQQPAVVNHPSMYPGYMATVANPYGGPHYYMPHQHYQNGAMASPAYMAYSPSAAYGRSPPAVQHYGMPMPPNYPRFAQHSPIVSSPYHPPLAPVPSVVPPLPHTPSSTHSHVVPPPMSPPVRQAQEAPQPPEPVQASQQSEPQHEQQREPRPESQPAAQPVPAVSQQPSVAPVQQSPTLSVAPAKEPFRPPVSGRSFIFLVGPSSANANSDPVALAISARVPVPHAHRQAEEEKEIFGS